MTSKPRQCDGRERKPLPSTSEADLAELRRCLRSAPSERAILITSIGMLLLTIGAAAAIVIAVTSLGG